VKDLTARQALALGFIRSCIEQQGYPPTLREIGAHMGIHSTNGVNDHLRALERKGYITRDDLKSRGLRVVDTSAPPPPPKPSVRNELTQMRDELQRQKAHLDTCRMYTISCIERIDSLLGTVPDDLPYILPTPRAS